MFLETKELSVSNSRTRLFHDIARGIRRGCALRPVQAFRHLFGANSSCVWGALIEADYELTRTIDASYGGMSWNCPLSSEHNPEFAYEGITLRSLLIHLNDFHHKSREWIAEWVEIQQ